MMAGPDTDAGNPAGPLSYGDFIIYWTNHGDMASLTRRALLGLAGAIGLTGRVGANDDDDDAADASPTGSGLYGAGLYGAGVYHDPAAVDDDDDAVDECFIATAAEGTKAHPHVVQLRDFRDATLRSSAPGRLFIRAYYATSPPVAAWIARSDRRRRWTRRLLVRPLSRAVTAAGLTTNTNTPTQTR